MGNENSFSKGIKGAKRLMDKFDCKIISTEYNSNYNGVKTCLDNSDIIINNTNGEKENEKSRLNLSTECSTQDLCDKEIKVSVKFEWKEGGKVVYLTGSFNNWSQWFIMNRTNGNYFELVLVISFLFCLRNQLINFGFYSIKNLLHFFSLFFELKIAFEGYSF